MTGHLDRGTERPLVGQRASTAAVLCTVAILAIVLPVCGWRWSHADRTELAQWAMAGTSIATLLAAIVAAVFAAGAFRLESAREDRWEETQRTMQASQVAAWLGVIERESPQSQQQSATWGVGSLLDLGGSYTVEGLYLRNASDIPVTRVVVRVMVGTAVAFSRRVATLGPSDEPVFLDLTEAEEASVADARLKQDGDAEVGVTFTDAAGVDWIRAPGLGLSEGRGKWLHG